MHPLKGARKQPPTLLLSAVLAMSLVGGWCDGTARTNECLVSHLAAIGVQKGRNGVSLLLWVYLQGFGSSVSGEEQLLHLQRLGRALSHPL